MKLPRRRLLHMAACAAALPFVSRTVRAQTYPSRPVRIVVSFPAGGGVDIIARLIGQFLSERLGQPFLIENRPGAAGTIGTETVVKAPPDGYTLLLFTSSVFTSATLYDKLNFNFVRDTAPVGLIARGAFVIVVNPLVPARTVPEFIAYAKVNPGKMNMASSGNGSSIHISGELFKMMAGIDMVHVPYRGAAPALTDLMAGQVQVMFADVGSVVEYIRTGKLRALAVTTATHSEVLPGISPASEFVPGYEASLWNGFVAPNGTSFDIIEKLNKEIRAAAADSKIKARLMDLGSTAYASSPAELGNLIAGETEKWAKVIRAANIKPE
jgi:tripartite-type tricarboxylate transporter receptor subunit TctC